MHRSQKTSGTLPKICVLHAPLIIALGVPLTNYKIRKFAINANLAFNLTILGHVPSLPAKQAALFKLVSSALPVLLVAISALIKIHAHSVKVAMFWRWMDLALTLIADFLSFIMKL